MSDDHITRDEMLALMDSQQQALVQHAIDAGETGARQEALLAKMATDQETMRLNQSDITSTLKSISDNVGKLDDKMDTSIRRQGELTGSTKHLTAQSKDQFEQLGKIDTRIWLLENNKKTVPKSVTDVAILIASNKVGQVIVAATLLAAVYGVFALVGIDVTGAADLLPGGVK